MNLFNYLMARKGHNTSPRDDLFAYLLGKVPKVVKEVTGVTIYITDVSKEKIISLWLDKESSQDGTPTPSNPVSVEVVEGYTKDGNNYVDVTVRGKNLFNKDSEDIEHVYSSTGSYSVSAAWNTSDWINVESNTQYALSYKTTGSVNMFFSEFDENKTFIQRTVASILTPQSSTKYVRLSYKNDLGVYDIQVEKGSVATSYEPYQESIVSIPLNGNFIAGIGDYKDTLMVDKSGKCYLNKKIIKLLFNGQENWSTRNSSVGQLYELNVLEYNLFKTSSLSLGLCNQYIPNIQLNADNTFRILTGITLAIHNDTAGSLVNFKDNLSNKNLIVYYPLEQEELIDLNYTIDLKLFIGENNISNSEDMMMTLKYY